MANLDGDQSARPTVSGSCAGSDLPLHPVCSSRMAEPPCERTPVGAVVFEWKMDKDLVKEASGGTMCRIGKTKDLDRKEVIANVALLLPVVKHLGHLACHKMIQFKYRFCLFNGSSVNPFAKLPLLLPRFEACLGRHCGSSGIFHVSLPAPGERLTFRTLGLHLTNQPNFHFFTHHFYLRGLV